jgi:probable HAF family extracellular repeat protein
MARAILFLTVSYCANAEQYSLTDLGTLGGGVSVGEAINNNGQVTGITKTADGTATAFLYSGGKMTDLGIVAGGTFSEGSAINAAGVVAGTSGIPGVSVHAVIFSNGQVIDLGTLGSHDCAAEPGRRCLAYLPASTSAFQCS